MPPVIVREDSPPLMWRTYSVGINDANKLTLTGATGKKWNEVELAATCYVGTKESVAAQMQERMRNSKVFMPGALENRHLSNDIELARRRCLLHLENDQCSCGVWGYKSPVRVQKEYLNHNFWTGNSHYNTNVEVLCAVRIFGTILQGMYGYRASHSSIEAMFVPDHIRMYAQRDSGTLKPYFAFNQYEHKTETISMFVTTPGNPQYNAQVVASRLDPKVVWNKISERYRCHVIPIKDGVDHIAALSVQYPDPGGLYPSERLYPLEELD